MGSKMAFTDIINNTSTPRGSTTSQFSNDSVTFKVFSSEHDETRLFLIPRQCVTFPAVANRIAELFGVHGDVPLQVQYKDDEDDLVTVTTDEELRSALQLFSGKPSLRLIVSFKLNAIKSSSTGSKVISIQPDHAESVVSVKTNNTNTNPDSSIPSSAVCDAALEEAMEKLSFVPSPTAPFPAAAAVVAVHQPSGPADALPSASNGVDSTVRSEPVVVGSNGSHDHQRHHRHHQGGPKKCASLSKEERIKLREERQALKAKRESMASSLEKLEALGFTGKRGLCVRLLLKYDGDVDQVAMEMKAWAQAREAREKLKIEREQKKKLKEEYIAKKALIMAQKKEIHEEKKKRRELMLEQKKLKQELKQERALKKAEMVEKRKLLKEAILKDKELQKLSDPAFDEFKPQLAQLESMGFTCKHRNVRILQKVDGDVTKATEILAFKEKERLQAFAEKKDLGEFESANQAAFAKLAELGHVNKRLNYRLLKQNGGDVDKVILQLRIIDERKRHRAEMTKLLGAAELQAADVSTSNNNIVAQEAVVVG